MGSTTNTPPAYSNVFTELIAPAPGIWEVPALASRSSNTWRACTVARFQCNRRSANVRLLLSTCHGQLISTNPNRNQSAYLSQTLLFPQFESFLMPLTGHCMLNRW